jgi:hypothetical protein
VLPLLFFILSLDFYLPSLRLEEGGRVGILWYLGVGILTHTQSPSSIQHTIKRRYPSIVFAEQVTKVK